MVPGSAVVDVCYASIGGRDDDEATTTEAAAAMSVRRRPPPVAVAIRLPASVLAAVAAAAASGQPCGLKLSRCVSEAVNGVNVAAPTREATLTAGKSAWTFTSRHDGRACDVISFDDGSHGWNGSNAASSTPSSAAVTAVASLRDRFLPMLRGAAPGASQRARARARAEDAERASRSRAAVRLVLGDGGGGSEPAKAPQQRPRPTRKGTQGPLAPPVAVSKSKKTAEAKFTRATSTKLTATRGAAHVLPRLTPPLPSATVHPRRPKPATASTAPPLPSTCTYSRRPVPAAPASKGTRVPLSPSPPLSAIETLIPTLLPPPPTSPSPMQQPQTTTTAAASPVPAPFIPIVAAEAPPMHSRRRRPARAPEAAVEGARHSLPRALVGLLAERPLTTDGVRAMLADVAARLPSFKAPPPTHPARASASSRRHGVGGSGAMGTDVLVSALKRVADCRTAGAWVLHSDLIPVADELAEEASRKEREERDEEGDEEGGEEESGEGERGEGESGEGESGEEEAEIDQGERDRSARNTKKRPPDEISSSEEESTEAETDEATEAETEEETTPPMTAITDAESLRLACSSYSRKHARFAEAHAKIRSHEREVGALHCGAREAMEAAAAAASADAASTSATAAAAAWKAQASSRSSELSHGIAAAQRERDRLAEELAAERLAIERAQEEIAAAAAAAGAEARAARAAASGFESDDNW